MQEKKHYKLYKSGKQWLCMAIAITSATLGMSFASNAQADTDVQPQANQTAVVTSASTSSTNVESSTVSADSQSATVEVAENTNDSNLTSNVTTTENSSAATNDNSYAIAATSAKAAAATVTTPENGWNSNHTAFYQNGQTANGYVQADDGNYYMFKNGVRQSGVQKWMGTYYYFDPSSYLRVDNDYREQVWQDGTHNWYMFGNDGRIVSGLYNWQGSTYYFDPSSYLRVDNDYRSTEADGRGVLLGSNGIALTGVQKWMGSYYYFDPVTKLRVDNDYRSTEADGRGVLLGSNGITLTGVQKWMGTYYYFDPVTRLRVDNNYVQSQWGLWYMFGDGGRIVTGVYNWQGSLYYFNPSSYLKETNTYVYAGGKSYWADENGILSEITDAHSAFLASIKEAAQAGWKQFGVLPSVTAAQAILESAWGQSALATQGHNLFGIKGNYNGQSIIMRTSEYGSNGYYYINDAFRKYPSNYESVVDHGRFLASNSRYNNLLWQKDYHVVTADLQADGYATAPTYASSLNRVIETYDLTGWDQEVF